MVCPVRLRVETSKSTFGARHPRGPPIPGLQPGPPRTRQRRIEMGRDSGADVGETLPPADRSRSDVRSEAKDGAVLAGMVGAAPARVVAVIRGDDREVAR